MANGVRDLRFGWRMLARNKGFAAVAILALALGIGPNVAIFSIIYATFLAPMPYPHAEQLVVVWTEVKGERNPTIGNDYLQYAGQSKSFQRIDFSAFEPFYLTDEHHVQEDIAGGSSTPGEYTGLYGMKMALGRDLQPADAIAGNDHVTVLTNRFWQERFHADPDIVGKPIRVNDQPYTVVGVLAPGVEDRIPSAHFIVPTVLTPGGENRKWGYVFARLKPGVTIAQAQAELSLINRRISRPELSGTGINPDQITVSVEPLRNDWLDKRLKRNLWLLLAAVGFVLLIACANLANLLLARGATRGRELALRSALGATRRQVFGQMVIESFALAATGGTLGVALGWALIKLIMAFFPDLANQNAEAVVQMNIPVMLFGLAASLLAGVLAGCAPAWHATQLNLSEILKQNARASSGSSRMRIQRGLVSGEFALALTLLGGAAMTLHSFWNLTHVDLGVRTDHILTAYIEGPRTQQQPSPDEINATHRLLVSRLNAIPGVESSALTTSFPLGGQNNFPFSIEGQPTTARSSQAADLEMVSPGYFGVFRAQLVRGRLFSDADTLTGVPVAMVSETFARRYLAGHDPLQQRLQLPTLTATSTGIAKPGPVVTRQIIGVFNDIRNGEHLADDTAPEMYIPTAQAPYRFIGIAVRTAIDPISVTQSVRDVVAQTMPGTALTQVQTVQQSIDKQLTGDRFSMLLFGGFALLALGLAALGIYGVIAFVVAQRGHEFGLRIALGAQRPDIIWMVLGDTLKMSLFGVGFGLTGMLILGHLLHSTLYGLGTLDLGGFAIVSLLLTAVALLASFVPAQRSSRTDPMIALRQE